MVAISLGVVAMLHLDKKEKQCNDRGGILIKATSQWICVDKVFIKWTNELNKLSNKLPKK